MSYRITIIQTVTKVKNVKTYEIVGTKEVPRDREYWVSDPKEPKTRIENVHGYVETEKEIDQELEVFKQTVEDLDLPSVIKAINRLA